MLTPFDDTLWHQLPATFAEVGTSDPRFFDRYWFAIYEPTGRAAIQFTLGVYNNMNVADGGFVVVHEGRQHNLRVSRSLRPNFEATCGPMQVDVVRPFEHFRLVVEPGEHAVSGELEWRGVLPPELEKPHFERTNGRVVQDYQRFDQIGECTGTLDIAGTTVEVNRWWACRDHSWGVRPGMGIPEPVTGLIRDRRDLGGGDLHVTDATLRIAFFDGTRRFRTVTLHLTLADGRRLLLDADALGPSIAMPGLGYSGGFDDGKGLGVWRGVTHHEADTWDVSDPAQVLLADGSTTTPVHRIQPVRVSSRGEGLEGEGIGSFTLIANGRLPQYGLD